MRPVRALHGNEDGTIQVARLRYTHEEDNFIVSLVNGVAFYFNFVIHGLFGPILAFIRARTADATIHRPRSPPNFPSGIRFSSLA